MTRHPRYIVHMDTPQTPAQRIRARMEALNVSELTLANDSGIPRTTLKRSLDGDRPFNTDELARVSRVLGITVAQLVSES